MPPKSIPHLLPLLLLTHAAIAPLNAEVKPNPLFSEGAVLQRDQEVPVWGTANRGEKVTVEFCGQTLSTTAAEGSWRINLKPLTAGGPFPMKISGNNTIIIDNLLVGEVWVCSGQSNMQFALNEAATGAVEIPKANYPKIRLFSVPRKTSVKPLTEVTASWVECSPDTARKFSAVGYFFGRDLYQKLGIFPFIFAQLAPFGKQPPEIREAQLLSLAKSPNIAMVGTADIGDLTNIHPKRKEPVGQRMALAARALAYGEKIEYSGPLYQSMKVESGKAVIRFTHVGGGLIAKEGPLKGFTIAGADQKFTPAQAEIRGAEVVVSSASVSAPVAVRYDWGTFEGNFFNAENLPASPFRTDVD